MHDIHKTRPDLNLLTIFDAVFRHGQVTIAAESLNLSQSAVSHALRRLRDVMNDPLFVRAHEGLIPTPKAIAIAAPVAQMLQLARQVLDTDAFDAKTTQRRFYIGVTEYSLLAILPDITRIFRREAPHAEIELIHLGPDAQAMLASGELDCAFWGGAAFAPPFHHIDLYQERFVGFVDKAHPLAQYAPGGMVELDDFLAFPHVLVRFANTGESPLDAALRRVNKARRVVLGVPSFTGALASLSGTDLVLSVPSRLAAIASSHDRACFELPLGLPDFNYRLIWHERMSSDRAFIWLRQLIMDAMSNTPA